MAKRHKVSAHLGKAKKSKGRGRKGHSKKHTMVKA